MKKILLLLTSYIFPLTSSLAQPAGVVRDTLQVKYIDFEGRTQQGVMICNKTIAKDLREIFAELYKAKYPIERIRPISEYGNDDERSMQANNTRATASGILRAARDCRSTPRDWPST